VPNLAGQNTSYLFEQMRAFAEGRRKDTFMEGLIKAMSTDEKVGAALFYAGQAVAPQAPADAALVSQGQGLYARTCVRCHGADGLGNEQIARIAGQQRGYLRLTLQRYRAGTGPRLNPLMQAETRLLTNPQIEALVAYVSAMR
jgi:cytochrome c553